MFRLFAVALVAAGLAACAAEAPIVRPPPEDPGNPQAAEAPPAPESRALDGNAPKLAPLEGSEAPPSGQGHGHHHHGAPPAPSHEGHEPQGALQAQPSQATPEAAVYSCPMHPEVQQDAPGRCPKCKMKLVPRQAAGDAS